MNPFSGIAVVLICNIVLAATDTEHVGFCNDPGRLRNGKREPLYPPYLQGFRFGESVHYSCNEGYRMVGGDRKIKCGKDSEWSPPVRPKCEEIPCGVPPVSHGRFRPERSEYPIGSTVTVSCQFAYKFESGDTESTLVCHSGGVWRTRDFPGTGRMPQCREITCVLPAAVPHGGFYNLVQDENGEVKLKSRVEYHCDDRFRLSDESKKYRQCIVDGLEGKWSDEAPTCVPSDCDRPPSIEHGQYVSVSAPSLPQSGVFPIDYKVYYRCAEGYLPLRPDPNQPLYTCSPDGTWYPAKPPVCITVENSEFNDGLCPEPDQLEHGVRLPLSSATLIESSSVHYRCHRGYTLQGSAYRMCTKQLEWSGTHPTCVPDLREDNDEVNMFMSTKIIAIATAASVFGVLVVVLIVVVVQRRSAFYQRLQQPETSGGQEGGQPCTVQVEEDDPDRMALIAYADGIQVVLPSYEEATGRGVPGRGSVRGVAGPMSGSVGGRLQGGRRNSPRPDTASIVSTTSGSIRGGRGMRLSGGAATDSLGSTQTVNTVNSSEVSTAITLDTTDTGSSVSPSVRATCGSLASSNESLINTEGAPLLDVCLPDTDSKKTNEE